LDVLNNKILAKASTGMAFFCVEYVLVCLWQIHIEFSGIIFQEFYVTSSAAAVYSIFG